MENVLFIGGNCSLNGLKERIIQDFYYLWHSADTIDKEKGLICVNKEKKDPRLMSYEGLYLLSLVADKDVYITKKEYQEFGAFNAIKRKNINKFYL